MKHCMRFAAEDIAHAFLPRMPPSPLPFLPTSLSHCYNFAFLTCYSLSAQLELLRESPAL